MSSIDNRILQMQFDNKQFENGVQTSIKSLDSLKKGLDLDGATKSLSNLDRAGKTFSLAGIAQGVDTLVNRFSTLGIIGITTLQNITNSAINAGKRIVSALTIDPIKAGLNEYETKMNAITTILTNTESKGTTLDDVNKTLNELNTYADKTIYNFAEMTRNIGTFTAAGVGLEESAIAIKGIANLAAGSGSNAQQASTAMYQLSQALAAGSLKLQDWNSVVNAGMGGELFRKALEKTAEELGHGRDMSISFRESLESGWITTEVLTKTLAKFAEDESLIKAATQVKTFTQLWDTMKESVQSGWAQSWEHIIGDREEAAAFFTAINNGFGAIVGSSVEARNEMLKFWNENGGRSAVIDALSNSFNALQSILKPIGEAFREVFPAMTGQRLVEISEKIKGLTENFKIGDSTAQNIKATFKGLFSILDIGKKVLISIGSGLLTLLGNLAPAGGGLLEFTAKVGDFLTNLNASVKVTDAFSISIDKIGDVVRNALTNVRESIQKAAPGFYNVASVIGGAFDNLRSFIVGAFNNADFNAIFGVINGGLFATILLGLKNFISSLTDITDGAGGFLKGVTGILDGVKGSLEAYQSSLKANTLLKIAGAIGILAASLLILSTIEPEKLSSSLSAMSLMFVELFASMAAFEKISGGAGILAMGKIVFAMIGLSTAILILSGAMTKLSKLDWNGIAKGLVGVGVMAAELSLFLKFTDSNGFGTFKGLGLLALAAAISVLASAVKKFGELDAGELIKGLTAVGVVLAELAIFVNLTGNAKGVMTTAVGLTILGASMLIFGQAVSNMGSMSWEQIGKGLTTMAGALTIIGVAISLMPSGMMAKSVALVAISTSLVILSKALSSMGGMTWEEIAKGLVTLAGSLTIISIAMATMTGALPGAAALIIVAGALAILTPVLKMLGEMSLGEIGKALLGLAGTFVVIGAASLVLSPLIPVILGLSAAIALFGVGCLAVGAGVLALSTGLTGLSVAGTAVATALVAIITSVVGTIPFIFQKLAEALVEFTRVLGDGIPTVVEAFAKLVVAILETLAEYVPRIVDAGVKLIIGFLKGIADNIKDVVATAIDVVVNFLKGITEMIPKVIQAGVDLIISFINGLANAIRGNTDKMISAIKNLMSAIIEAGLKTLTASISTFMDVGSKLINSGLIQGITGKFGAFTSIVSDLARKGIETLSSKIGDFRDVGSNVIDGFIGGLKSKIKEAARWAASLAENALDAAKETLGINSPSREFAKIGMYADEGLAVGLKKFSGTVKDSATNVGKTAIDSLSRSVSKISDVINGDIDINPTIRPVLDMTNISNGLRSAFDKKQSLNVSSVSSKAGLIATSSSREPVLKNNPSNEISNTNNSSIIIQNLHVRNNNDAKLIAEELYYLQQTKRRARGAI